MSKIIMHRRASEKLAAMEQPERISEEEFADQCAETRARVLAGLNAWREQNQRDGIEPGVGELPPRPSGQDWYNRRV
jgi:hypothetical protein